MTPTTACGLTVHILAALTIAGALDAAERVHSPAYAAADTVADQEAAFRPGVAHCVITESKLAVVAGVYAVHNTSERCVVVVVVIGLVSTGNASSNDDAPLLAHSTFAGERADKVDAHAGVGAGVPSQAALVLVHAPVIGVRDEPIHTVTRGQTAHLAGADRVYPARVAIAGVRLRRDTQAATA